MEGVQKDTQQSQVECTPALWTAQQWKQFMDDASGNEALS